MGNLLNLTGIAKSSLCTALIIFGAAECFLGFKISHAVVTVLGFAIGGVIGFAIGHAIADSAGAAAAAGYIAGAFVALVFAFIFSLINFKFYSIGTFVGLFLAGFVVGYFLLSIFIDPLSVKNTSFHVVTGIIIGILFGLTGFVSVRISQLIFTSFIGCFMLAAAGYVLFRNMYGDIFNIITAVVFFAAGITVQSLTTKHSKKTYSEDEEDDEEEEYSKK